MSDTRALLHRIQDLRHRLAQMKGLVGEADRAAAALLQPEPGADTPLNERVAEGERRQALLDASLRQLADGIAGNEIRPTRLIARVRHLLERGRDLVLSLRKLAEEPLLSHGDPIIEEAADDPLLSAFRDTSAMAESALRLVQAFPDAPSGQLRLADGLESILTAIGERVESLAQATAFRRSEIRRRDSLASLLRQLAAGEDLTPDPFLALAEELIAEQRAGTPLHFLHAPARKPAEFTACHSLTTARVAIRMIRHDPDWQKFAFDVVTASLLKDVGMLKLDGELLGTVGPLTDEQMRAVEGHARTGAELVARHLPAAAPLCEAIISHHERIDGTGYPGGLKGTQIGPLPRLMALADVYAALCCPRPHRAALEPRAALTETLLMAERGLLDSMLAERLLFLAFYPVGSVVEMADGSVGVVVATHLIPRQLQSPGRPVVAVLADAEGRLFPTPRHLDLAEVEGRAIVRSLNHAQRRDLLGRRYPELV